MGLDHNIIIQIKHRISKSSTAFLMLKTCFEFNKASNVVLMVVLNFTTSFPNYPMYLVQT